jgi:hypothetical protein
MLAGGGLGDNNPSSTPRGRSRRPGSSRSLGRCHDYVSPQLTEEARRKIIGENLPRLHGMDVEDTKKKYATA